MRIAIVTWFHYPNYGTALQVYALYKYLCSKGYDVKVVQYYPKLRDMYYKSLFEEFSFRLKRKIHSIFSSPGILDKMGAAVFNQFVFGNIEFTEKVETDDDFKKLNEIFDVFICGSDQIWSPLNFDSHYYLEFVDDSSKTVSYAPSMGVMRINQPDINRKIADLTGRFRYLSVRERTGADLIKSLNGRQAEIVIDPTLLFHKEDWDTLLPDNEVFKPYVLAYFLRENKKYWNVVKDIARELEYELRIIPVYEDDLKMDGKKNGKKKIYVEREVGPERFLTMFRHASYICTDSFHGIAFAVNYNKAFLPFQRFADSALDNQNSRVFDFLESVGLRERMYHHGNDYFKAIDYNTVNTRLEGLRKHSYAFLDEAINSIEGESV